MRTIILPAILMAALTPSLAGEALAQERREIPEYREINIPAESEAQRELHAFLDAFREAWGNEDTDALMALHLPDTEWINAYARMFTDTGNLGQFLETRLFPNFAAGVSRQEADNMALISMRMIGSDAAVIHLFTDGARGPSIVDGRALRRTHIHLVLSKTDNQWKIAHTAIMDARS